MHWNSGTSAGPRLLGATAWFEWLVGCGLGAAWLPAASLCALPATGIRHVTVLVFMILVGFGPMSGYASERDMGKYGGNGTVIRAGDGYTGFFCAGGGSDLTPSVYTNGSVFNGENGQEAYYSVTWRDRYESIARIRVTVYGKDRMLFAGNKGAVFRFYKPSDHTWTSEDIPADEGAYVFSVSDDNYFPFVSDTERKLVFKVDPDDNNALDGDLYDLSHVEVEIEFTDSFVPTISVTAPTSNQYVTTLASVNVTMTATDAGGSMLDRAYLNNLTTGYADGPRTMSGSSASIAFGGVPLVMGVNSIQLRAYDKAGNQTSKTITLNRVNRGTLQFKAAEYAAAENGGSIRIYVSRTEGAYGAASVAYTTANGRAMAGADYTTQSSALTWVDGDQNDKSFVVPVLDDATYEGTEEFTVHLAGANGASLGSQTATTVIIGDNETPPRGTVRLASSNVSVSEGGGSLRICVIREDGNSGGATVRCITESDSASHGSEYTGRNEVLSWADGEDGTKVLDIEIIDDTVVDASKQFRVYLSDATGATIGSPSVTTVAIMDDEVPPSGTLQFAAATASVAENSGTVRVLVNRVGGTHGMVGVNVSTVDGTAFWGSDYAWTTAALVWPDGNDDQQAVDVAIRDDNVYEGQEYFTVRLSGATGTALGDPSDMTVLVEDDEVPASGTVQFSQTTWPVNEGDGVARVWVTRSSGSYGAARVTCTTVAGSAGDETDFSGRSEELQWTDGDLGAKSFDIAIADDQTYEGNESFTVRLSNAVGAPLGSPGTSTVVIADNESTPRGTIRFATSTCSVSETGGVARIRVARVGGASGIASVTYGTAGVSATPGTDFLTSSAKLTWPDGDDSEKEIVVSVRDDPFCENDETFVVKLTSATGVSLGVPATNTVTIIDNETPPTGFVALKSALVSVGENEGRVRLYVGRREGRYGAARVDFTTENREAVAGSDYVTNSNTLYWTDGEDSDKSLDVVILRNAPGEGSEAFTVRLANVQGARMGYPESTIVNITPFPAPDGLAASDGAYTDKVVVTWSAIPRAWYRVIYKTSLDASLNTMTAWQSGTIFVHQSATPGQLYYYWVQSATNSTGASLSGVSAPDAGWRRPATPKLTATQGTYLDRVQVTWDAVKGATHYRLYCSGEPDGARTALTGWTTQRVYADPAPEPGRPRWYWVEAAVNAAGERSSDVGMPVRGWRGMGGAPRVYATRGVLTQAVAVFWTSVRGANGYRVYRSTGASLVGTPIGAWTSDLSLTDTTAIPGVVYYYRVISAVDGVGSLPGLISAPDQGWRGLLPPTGVHATDGDLADRTRVSWDAVVGASHYRVFRSAETGGMAAAVSTWVTVRTFDDSTAVPGVVYRYTVRAAPVGTGDRAGAAGGPDVGWRGLLPPTLVRASDGTFVNFVRLSWQRPAGGSFCQVYRAATTNDPRVAVSGWQTTNTFDDPAPAGQAFHYWIRSAADGAGVRTGAYSVPDRGWRALAAPAGMTAGKGASTDRVDVAWQDVPGANTYRVYRATTAGGPKVPVSGWLGTLQCVDTNATPGVTYFYTVRATWDGNEALASPYSAPDTGWRALGSSGAIWASDGTSTDRIKVAWRPVRGASWYRVIRSSATAGPAPIGAWISTTNYDDLAAAPGFLYRYSVVAALNNVGTNASMPGSEDEGWRALTAPTGVTASDGTSADFVRVNWSAIIAQGVYWYQVYAANSATDTGVAVSGWIQETVWDHTNGSAGQQAYYYVRAAVDGAGNRAGPRSTADTGWRSLPGPLGVVASQGEFGDRIVVNWPPVPGASHYRVSWAPSAVGAKTVLRGWGAANSFAHTNATRGVIYFYFVQASGNSTGACPSAYSAPASGWRANTADLLVTGILLTPASPVAGKSFTAEVTVTNGSDETVSGGSLDVWVNRPAEAPIGSRGDRYTSVGTLTPRQSKKLSFSMTAPAAEGDYVFRAFVDSQGAVAEKDDTNNQRTFGYHVNATAATVDFTGFWLARSEKAGSAVLHFEQSGSTLWFQARSTTIANQSFVFDFPDPSPDDGLTQLTGSMVGQTISGLYRGKDEGVDVVTPYTASRVSAGTMDAHGTLDGHDVDYSGAGVGVIEADDGDLKIQIGDARTVLMELEFESPTFGLLTTGSHAVSVAGPYQLQLSWYSAVIGNLPEDEPATGGTVTLSRCDARVVGTYNLQFRGGAWSLSGSFDVPSLALP